MSTNLSYLVAEQLYTNPCVFVCLSVCVSVCVSVCLFVPRFVCPLFRTSTKAWMTPGKDQLYSGEQTDDWATILEQKTNSAQTKGVPVCNSTFNENFTFS